MTTSVLPQPATKTSLPLRSHHPVWRATRQVLRAPVGLVGTILVGLFIGLAIFAPLIAPFDPIEQPAARLLPPGAPYWLGTDDFGRDILSRILWGARISLQVGIISVTIALIIGATLGILCGYAMGTFDNIVMRLVDIMFAFPTVILVVALASVIGPSTQSAMIAIGIVYAPLFVRIARGPTLAVMQKEYIEGARAVGVKRWGIMWRYVLPNISASLIVQTTLSFSTAILTETALSFLGLGTQPPDPSWGTMLGDGRRFMEAAPWLAIYPGLAIAVTVLGLNLIGDALRDALDPRAGIN